MLIKEISFCVTEFYFHYKYKLIVKTTHFRNKMGKKVKSGEKDGNGNAEKFYYTILAPKIFRANTDFTLNVTIHDEKNEINEAIVVRATIESVKSIEDSNSQAEFKVHRDITLKSNVTELVSIPIGNVPTDGNYKLIVKGISGIELECESALELQLKTHIIFVQTDKGVYKPSDCIRFRVLALDSELKAAAVNKNELKISVTVSLIPTFSTVFSQFFFSY